jgi:hypothetical protein
MNLSGSAAGLARNGGMCRATLTRPSWLTEKPARRLPSLQYLLAAGLLKAAAKWTSHDPHLLALDLKERHQFRKHEYVSNISLHVHMTSQPQGRPSTVPFLFGLGTLSPLQRLLYCSGLQSNVLST